MTSKERIDELETELREARLVIGELEREIAELKANMPQRRYPRQIYNPRA